MTDTGKVKRYIIDPVECDQYSIEYSEHNPAWQFVSASDYDALRAEVEALRKDAERYRWIRARYNAWPDLDIWGDVSAHGPGEDRLDRAIDAAMGKP